MTALSSCTKELLATIIKPGRIDNDITTAQKVAEECTNIQPC